MSREMITLTADEVVHCTDAAALVVLDGEKVWIPKSQIDDDSWDELKAVEREGCAVDFEMTQWFAEKEGLW